MLYELAKGDPSMLKAGNIKQFLLWSGAISVLLLIALKLSHAPAYSADKKKSGKVGDDKSEIVQKIIEDRFCPCGCGKFLPGSRHRAACFGCSVGKAEVTRVIEGLSAGRQPDEIAKELNEPVLVDVFSDYTDERLSEIWERVNRSAGEYNQHRVVLRALGRTSGARRAIRLAECARANGMFTEIQSALIEHSGPWDERALMDLAIEHGMNEEQLSDCLRRVKIDAQISKDRQHAEMLKIEKTPVVSVNQKITLPTDEDIRRAIRKIVMKESI